MKIAIITVAGISSRFNQDIKTESERLKAIYYDVTPSQTLLYHLVKKCEYADKIIIVGGYQYNELEQYIIKVIPPTIRRKIVLVKNDHYKDLASGYSLFLGIKSAFEHKDKISEILFVEGDLDIDLYSFSQVVRLEKSVLTYNTEPIFANKSVVLYMDAEGCYQYAFSKTHGNLLIKQPFQCILNSGQLWKFRNIEVLKKVNDIFGERYQGDTNLKIIQMYIDRIAIEDIELVRLRHWINCNTREDYKLIEAYWEDWDEKNNRETENC